MERTGTALELITHHWNLTCAPPRLPSKKAWHSPDNLVNMFDEITLPTVMGTPLADQCAGPELWRKDPAGRCALASLDCLPAAEPSPAVQPVRPPLDSTVPQTFLTVHALLHRSYSFWPGRGNGVKRPLLTAVSTLWSANTACTCPGLAHHGAV